jgi:exodeoxyribonuclease V gamma subunit
LYRAGQHPVDLIERDRERRDTIRLWVSNSYERLSDLLAEKLQIPLDSPFTPEVIVVRTMGMAKWLSTELAKGHSICSNYRFLFPNAFIDDIFHSLCQTSHRSVLFEREIMLWRIMGIVPI